MTLKFYGKDTEPISLNNDLTNIGGIDSEGLIHWYKVTDLYPDVSCDVVSCGSEPAPLTYIDECLNNNIPVIVETRFGQNESSPHFVTLTKKNGEYWCNDPWFGDNASFNQRYGDPARWIYSVITYKTTAGNNNITIPKDTFEMLVTKATKYDEFVALGYADPAKVKQSLSEYQVELDGLKKEIQTLKGHLTDIAITLQVLNNQPDIMGAIERLKGIEDLKVSLEMEVNNLRGQVEELKRDKERLTGELNSTKTELATLYNALQGLEKEKATITADLNTCQLKLQNLIEQGMGSLVKTLYIGNYIIQFFRKL
jgi:prefoldin subunit 5